MRILEDIRLLVGKTASETGCPEAAVMVAGLMILLRRYSGADRLNIQVSVSGGRRGKRSRVEARCDPGLPAIDLVRTVSDQMPDYDGRRATDHPFLEVTFRGYGKEESADGGNIPPAAGGGGPTDGTISVFRVLTRGSDFSLECGLEDTILENEATARWFCESYGRILEDLCRHPRKLINELNAVSDTMREQILAYGRDRTDYPRNDTVHGLFESILADHGSEVALVCGERSLTYNALNRRAERVREVLAESGIGRGDRVGVCMRRSIELIVSFLGILKAGAVYVPMDVSDAPERLNEIAEDAQASLVLAGPDESEWFSGLKTVDPTALEADKVEISQPGADREAPQVAATSPAYLMYTSGSTGKPKGCLIPHRGIIRLVRANRYASFGRGEVFLFLASPAFDAATFEIWGALLNGLTLVILADEHPGISEIEEVIERGGVTTCWFTAGLFHVLIEEGLQVFRNLHQVLAGGDVLSPGHVRRLRREYPDLRVINGYGPTENTTFSCCCQINEIERIGERIPVGKSISNSEAYVLNERLEPVPIGAKGEIYLGGDGLTPGYWGRPELNAERFVNHPFEDAEDARLYRTGDFGRLLPSGNIDFLGRTDHQIKVRGYRVELGEIEKQVEALDCVRACIVTSEETTASGARIRAYVSAAGDTEDSDRWRKALARRLPGYMIPDEWIVLERFPLNKQGKIDRAELARYAREARAGQGSAPATDTEKAVAAIWGEVLETESISRESDFLRIGGESISAIRVAGMIADRVGINVTLEEILERSVLQDQASMIDDHRDDAARGSYPRIRPRIRSR